MECLYGTPDYSSVRILLNLVFHTVVNKEG